MESVTETLARVAGEHEFEVFAYTPLPDQSETIWGCTCGVVGTLGNFEKPGHWHAAHVATAQAAALDPHFDAARREAVLLIADRLESDASEFADKLGENGAYWFAAVGGMARSVAADTWSGGER